MISEIPQPAQYAEFKRKWQERFAFFDAYGASSSPHACEAFKTLAGTSESTERDGRPLIADRRTFPGLDEPDLREKAYQWLVERVNTFVNVFRPRVRSVALDYEQHPK